MRPRLGRQTTLLMKLGLTELQARIYLLLLKERAQTGYRIARALDVPVANTYKALESLRKAGLVLSGEGGRTRTYSAQPIALHLDQKAREFARHREQLEESLQSVVPANPDEGCYAIESAEQLYAVAVDLLKKGDGPIAVDATPHPLDVLRGDLQEANRAGRTVLVKSYAAVELPGCVVAFSETVHSPMSGLAMQLLQLVVPGEGYVIGITDRAGHRLLHGIYVRNLLLSIVAYNGFTMEFFVTKAVDGLHRGRPAKEILEDWRQLEHLAASRTSAWRAFETSLDVFERGDEV